VKVLIALSGRERPHEAYDRWYRLGKKLFQVHGVDEQGKPLLKKQLKRDPLATF
jgi:hypothetical protein